MRVSGLLITHQLSEEAARWFEAVVAVVDELVAFVDAERAAPEVRERLERLGARIFSTSGAAFYNFDFKQMFHACKGDWILKVDYDEQLSPEWQDMRWRELLEQDEFVQFWVPRRWLVSSEEFIACEPWWPDWQLRLFRNLPEQIEFPTLLHDTMTMQGPAGYLRNLAIHHHDLRLNDRRARERKASSYLQARPGKSLGYFYLYEDYRPTITAIPRAASAPSTEILRMPPLSNADIVALKLSGDPAPDTLATGELLWLDVTVSNGGSMAVCCGAPNPVNLAYHWLDANTQEPLVFDGERTAIVPELPPGQRKVYRMFIVAPNVPGNYTLRVTLVQEYRCWLYQIDPALVLDSAVRVT